MTTELIEQEIQRFLESKTPEVLCLRGRWGVGKTYIWNHFLNNARDRNKTALSAYSYVSLFGINTLEELKLAILANTVVLRTPTDAEDSSLRKKLSRWWRQGIGTGAQITQEIPFIKEYVGNLPALSFHLIKETIVCIDDLERKGKDLRVLDVLGVMSDLKETKRCKVMLILNDGQFAHEEDKNDFLSHNEKVIDASLEFAPTAADCVRISIREDTNAHALLSENCIKLGISNIRIIKKIERFVMRANEMLSRFDEQILRQAIHTLTLLTWTKFSEEGPPLSFIKEKTNPYWSLGERNKLSKEEEQWASLLKDYGFHVIDEFDTALLEGVERGFFDEEKVHRFASVIQQSIEANQSAKTFSDAWNLYYDSFQDNLDEVISEIEKAFYNSIRYVSPLNLDGTIRLFKELGYGERTKKMIADYVASRAEDRSFFDPSTHSLLRRTQDEDVRKAFNDALIAIPDTRLPATVLVEIGRKSGWNQEDVALLNKLSEEDFYRLFKEHSGETLSNIIRASLRFGGADDARNISERAKNALRRIGLESRLNELRVQGYLSRAE